ncbi:MAG: DNA starvation/stationary phase protection protein [Dysgonamonadaceae bacterium]|jgi:starvation-inducible DNA-binding protein|nr:DNA starvation/stationary phase protection protein [Dysgonamonadaceae bacterium]MDD3355373.1 DNA starvation/stationary phase protection protein [Dysgonamonadaceae bacterium]MDD3726967.1 DNA starvation/stationary phase protection protein [Dysgonamonadaceae bacterium]MDD4245745.1 DNA starvation/stationary phase protection protein [Dysgonamonadaceae bacterium]MDD4604857.1 DNA starvation/stationary phase protection protein [Dysgonamonadaceae bacterium]
MKKINIGITDENRQTIADQLAKILADEFVLYSKTLNAHWNIEGPDFHAAHLYLETLYNQQQKIVDTVAEKIRAVGHYVPGQLNKYLELTHLSESSPEKNDSQTYYADLLNDHESIIVFLRENIKPFADKLKAEGISDYITGLMEHHEKTAWMLRSHLKK